MHLESFTISYKLQPGLMSTIGKSRAISSISYSSYTAVIHLYLMRVVGISPCSNSQDIAKRSRTHSKLFATVNLNTTDDD